MSTLALAPFAARSVDIATPLARNALGTVLDVCARLTCFSGSRSEPAGNMSCRNAARSSTLTGALINHSPGDWANEAWRVRAATYGQRVAPRMSDSEAAPWLENIAAGFSLSGRMDGDGLHSRR
jgi:hypothetical protein